MIKEIKCYKCLKCNTIYLEKKEARDCDCDKRCSNNCSGFHSWEYVHSFMGMSFYKCECGKEMTGITEYKKDPFDEIFVDKLHSIRKKFPLTNNSVTEEENAKA